MVKTKHTPPAFLQQKLDDKTFIWVKGKVKDFIASISFLLFRVEKKSVTISSILEPISCFRLQTLIVYNSLTFSMTSMAKINVKP